MSTTRIILIVGLLLLAGFSIFQKHVRQKQGEKGNGQGKGSGKSSFSEAITDDYEPYSGK